MKIVRLALALALLGVVSIAGALAPRLVSALETSYQNPVTAGPPLNRPTTPSCIVSLAQNQAFPFAGYDMPVWYTSVSDEHAAVRIGDAAELRQGRRQEVDERVGGALGA